MRYLIPLVLTFNVTYLYAQAIDFNSEFDKSISVSDANSNTISSINVWKGDEITITRANNSDQVFDTLTSSVIVTRGSDGLLYNSAAEDAANQQSPEGMLWYEGVLENFNEDDKDTLDHFLKLTECEMHVFRILEKQITLRNKIRFVDFKKRKK